jgi:hypothetical protein
LKSIATTVATPREMARAEFAAQSGGDAFDVDPGRGAGRVEVGGGRREDQAGAGGFATATVVLERPRVFREILVGAELGRVDEDRDHDEGGFLLRPADEAEVSLVQATHRRHETDGLTRLTGPGDRVAQFGDGVDDLHAANLGGSGEGARRRLYAASALVVLFIGGSHSFLGSKGSVSNVRTLPPISHVALP